MTALLVLPPGALAVVSAPLKLSPQDVVRLALEHGRGAKAAQIAAQRGLLAVEIARGIFDWDLRLEPSYLYASAQNLEGINNLNDRNAQLNASIGRAFSLGTALRIGYRSITQRSSVSSFTATLRPPVQTLDAITAEVRQSFWRNAFGSADRWAVEAAKRTAEAAQDERVAALETVALDALTRFWECFVARRKLDDALEARDRYQALVTSVSRKSAFGLATPGELARLQAEHGAAQAQVKQSAAAYLDALDALLTRIGTTSGDDVVLVTPDELPPVPRLASKDVDSLRANRAARSRADALRASSHATDSRNDSRVDLVLRAASTGVEPAAERARAEMVAVSRPDYYVGLEFQTSFDSAATRARRIDAKLAADAAETDALMVADQTRDRLRAAERDVNARFASATLAHGVSEQRSTAVRQIEGAYRNGRQTLVEVIRAYNDLYAARLAEAEGIGNYHLARNRLAAARDELILTTEAEARSSSKEGR